jgi:chromate reductase
MIVYMRTNHHDKMNVLGIAGSLRKGSYNRALLRAAQEVAPKNMEIEPFDLSPIPFFNEDVEKEGDPEPVKALKQAISRADALLIATPEYQYGVPGVLKNALDWASRPAGKSPMQHKPVAIIGASTGFTGTARAQLQLRQTLAYNETHTLMRPEVLVARAREKFDEDGQLNDDDARDFLRTLLEKLYDWTLLLQDKQELVDA